MCLPVAAALSSSEVSGGAFKLYACYCAHREGFEANIKNEQIHAETGLGYAYISTLKYELLEAGWIGLSKIHPKGVVPLKGFEGAAGHTRSERKLSKIEIPSDKKPSNIEKKSGEVSTIESPAERPEKLSNIETSLSDVLSNIERNPTETFENQKEISGTPIAPLEAETTSKNNPQPSVEARRKRPPPRREPKAFDPRIKHPAIQAVRGFIHSLPDEQNRDEVIEALGESPDMRRLSECYRVWKKQGWNKISLVPATDWYVNGIPERLLNADKGGGNGKQPVRSGGRSTYNDRANAALAELYDLEPVPRT